MSSALSAGYTCNDIKMYTSCNAGYYMTVDGTPNTTAQVGNACTLCEVGYYCPGGSATSNANARLDCDTGSTTTSANNYWTTKSTGSTARTQCYRTVTLSKNSGNGTVSLTNAVTGTTASATSTTSVSTQCYYGTSCALPTITDQTSSSHGVTNGLYSGYYKYCGGWSSSSTTLASCPSTTTTSVTVTSTASSVTYYAQKTGDDFTITLNNNSATTAGTTAIYTRYGVNVYLDSAHATAMTTTTNPITIPTKTGYTFDGYAASTSGCTSSTTRYISATGYRTSSLTTTRTSALYACWVANTYTVSFDANGGSGGQTADVTATYGVAMPTISTTKPTKTGCKFNGWYSAASGGTQYYTAAGASARAWNIAGDRTLYAQWTCMSVTGPTAQTKVYDGTALTCNGGISVSSPSGATITYATSSTGTYTSTAPTITNVADSKTIYYKISATDYTDKTGSFSCTVTKADWEELGVDHSRVYDGTAMTCTGLLDEDGPSGATIKYGTTAGTYNLTSAPTVTNVADSKTIYFQVTHPNYVTQTGSFGCTIENATISASASNKTLTYNGSAQSCGTVSVTTPSSGATVKYGTASGSYTSTSAISKTDAGTYTIYYQVTATNYTTKTGSFTCTVNKAANPISLSATSGSINYNGTGTFTVSGAQGTLSVSSASSTIATASVSGTTVTMTGKQAGSTTITVTAAGNDNYLSGSKTYSVTVNKINGTTTLGAASGTLTYPTTSGSFTVSCSESATPTVSLDTSTYASATVGTGQVSTTWKAADGTTKITVNCPATTNYKASSATYTLYTKKAVNPISLSATSGSITYPSTGTFTVSGAQGTVSVTSGTTSVATASVSGTTVTMTPVKYGTSTITVTAAGNANYYSGSKTYALTVNRGTCSISVSPTTATITYPTTTGTFTVSKGSCNGTLSAASNATGVATVSLSGTTGTVTWKSAGTATITVTAAQSDQYNATTATYKVTTAKGTNPISLSATSGSIDYNGTGTFTVSGAQGTLSVSSASSTIATASVSGTTVTMTGKQAGSTTITVTAAGNDNYLSGSKTYSVTVNKINGTTTLGAASGTLTYPTTSGSFTVSCSESATPTVSLDTSTYASATVGTGQVSTTWKAADGTTKITVNCPATTNYKASSATYTLYTKKAVNPISLSATSGSITYPSTGTFTVSGAQGTVSVTSGTTSVATASVSGTTVTMTPVKYGTSTITVTAAGNANYYSGSKTYALTVNRGTCSISVSPTTATITYPTTTGTFTVSKGSCNGTLSAASNATGVATVSLSGTTGTVTWKSAGTATITVTAAQSDQYNATTATYKVTTAKGTNPISLSATSGSIDYNGTGTFTVSGAQGTLSVSSASSTIATASVSGTTVTMTGKQAGSTTITVTAAGNDNYLSGSKTYSVTVNKINGTTTVSKTSLTVTYPTTTGTFTASCSENGTATVSSSDTSKATVAINSGTVTVTWKAAGSATITVNCAATTNYKASSKTVAVTTAKGTNTLKLSAASGTLSYTDSAKTKQFTVSTNTSGGTLSVSSNATGVATVAISGTTVTMTYVKAGTATITVTSAETSTYKSATATYALTVNCGAGYYSNSASCTKCPAGYYTSSANTASACTACTGATYQPYTGQSSCISCPTASNNTANVRGYSYWNTGATGDHTVSSGCNVTFNSKTLDDGTMAQYSCYVDAYTDNSLTTYTYGVDGTTKTCWVNRSNLTCDGGYYNVYFNASSTATQDTGYDTLDDLYENVCQDVGTGYWSAAGELTRTACTLAPDNASYTGSGGGTDNCPWVCNSGYNLTSDGLCGQFCEAGITHIKLSTGLSIPLYSSKRTSHTLVVKTSAGDMCYASLASGNKSGALNVNIGGTTYHAVD
ncbi:MAG: hypothetical protein E7009_00205 [Alphaproteobacteria bacterium]|nr:hypothetical protein [Alphaproteobacteria bacterium]